MTYACHIRCEDFARIHDILRIERTLDRLHQVNAIAVFGVDA